MIVGRIFSANILGFYTQSVKIETLTSKTLSTILSQVSYPLFVNFNTDYCRLNNILRQYCLGILAVIMPFMLCLAMASESVIYIMYGEKWMESAPILRILSFGGIFICLQAPTFIILASIGKSREAFRWTVIKRSVGICLILVGAFSYGFNGILYSMVITSAMIWLCNIWLISRFTGYKLHRQIRDLLPVVIPGAGSFAIIYSMQHLCLLGNHEFIYCAVYLAIYILMIYSLPNRSLRELRANITSVIRRTR